MEHIKIVSDYSDRIFELQKRARLANDDLSFELVSEATYNDFPALDQGAKRRVHVTLSTGDKVDFSEIDDLLQRALVLRSYTKCKSDEDYADDKIADIVADRWKVSFFDADLKDLAARLTPRAAQKILKKIKAREIAVRMSHSHTHTYNGVDEYNSTYTDLFTESAKVIVFNGQMASGKTVAMRSIYTEARAAGANPIFLTGKRTIASNFFGDSHDDHYQAGTHKDRKGVIGVINTLVGQQYDEDRAKCEIVFIDELEDLFSHIATGTIGVDYEDRIEAMKVLEELLKSAKKVVVADAMLTNQSIDQLLKMARGQAKILKTKPAPAPTISLGTKGEVLGVTRDRMNAGKRSAVFMDYNPRAFSEVAHALSHETGKEALMLNAEFFESSGKSVSEIDNIVLSTDASVISPVINAGASITLPDFDEISVLAGRTITPTSVLQSARRFRAADKIHLAFRSGRSSFRVTDPVSLIAKMISECENPVEEAQKLYATEHGKFLADYAAQKNRQFRHFEQSVLIAAEQMGFTIERPYISEEIKTDGQKSAKAGRRKNSEIQKDVAHKTSEKLQQQTKEGIDMGVSEERTFEQEVAARTIFGMQTLSISMLTDQTYHEIFSMGIDQVVSMRKRLSGKDAVSERMDIAGQRVIQLLEDAGVNLTDLSNSYVTTESAEYAYGKLIEPVAINDKATMSGLELVKFFFSDARTNVTCKFRSVVIKNILRELGYDLTATGNGRNRYYTLSDLVKKIDIDGIKEDCNISRITGKYEQLALTKKARAYPVKPEVIQPLITADEMRLAGSIDVKNQKAKEEAEKAGELRLGSGLRLNYLTR
ncbi:hypothetical protein MSNKSG1_00883 [Marinobacter santoriniensis NKSG1]|uniref:Uncharacterized protein n=1 Tax=Marinobacter santoriniensis NKSG1 TaxID=1288826 RepID=M7D8S7_9GAMM|nr:hypothetical protein [Marinobacter santoriniensis]EMP57133.1 hypothetical protein MSNKSG1_00883 [Marinobacter santoriniensis NKSG1]